MTGDEEAKTCTTCTKILPLSWFPMRSDTKRPNSQCRDCISARHSAYYQDNREKCAALVKRNYDTVGRFRRDGITQEMYDEALREQDGKCKLCGASEPGGKGVWHIDHTHDPGRTTQNGRFNQTSDPTLFRGLLCHRCNVSLGHYEMLVDRIGEAKLMRYLHPERLVEPTMPPTAEMVDELLDGFH